MIHRRSFLTGAGALVLAPLAARAETGFRPLYNGRNLDGWRVKDGKLEAWKADGPLLSCVQDGGGWLTTDRPYGDFELRLEYRIPRGGNSGVGIRYPLQGDPAHEGMEIQILDDNAPQYANLAPAQYNGGIYFQAAPLARPANEPGEWNEYRILCRGPRVIIHLNGVKIHDLNVDEHTRAEGNYKPLAQRPKTGFIGLQSHGNRVDFRNLRVRELG
jgi:hypothetical protein